MRLELSENWNCNNSKTSSICQKQDELVLRIHIDSCPSCMTISVNVQFFQSCHLPLKISIRAIIPENKQILEYGSDLQVYWVEHPLMNRGVFQKSLLRLYSNCQSVKTLSQF